MALEPASPPPVPAQAFSETLGSLEANLAAVSAFAAGEGTKFQNGLETRDLASHISLSIHASQRAGETGAAGVTGGVLTERRLTAEIQGELARLGCYDGPQDNIWGASSARAVRRLGRIIRLRARLSEPDATLLAELKGVSEPVCGPGLPQADNSQKSGLPQADGGRKSGQATGLPVAKIQDRLPVMISPAAVGLPDGGRPGASAAREGGGGSYLPPWMQSETMANAQAGQSVDGRPVDEVQSTAKKRAAAHGRARREWRERMRQRELRRSAWYSFF